jgi:hypothetical protein
MGGFVNPPKLSVLILTLKSRADFLDRLLSVLSPQCENQPVEVLIESDDGEQCIGEKRNLVLARAVGEYIAYIDDDDLIADDYVSSILKGIESGADCVGFKASLTKDGRPIGEQFWRWENDRFRKEEVSDAWTIWHRKPTHQCAVKRELALRVGFPPQNLLEDVDYIERLYPLLRSGAFIDKHLYFIQHRSYETRVGEQNYWWRTASSLHHFVRHMAGLPEIVPIKPADTGKRESHPDTAILIPTFGRADRLQEVVDNATANTPGAMVYLILEPHDVDSMRAAAKLGNPRVQTFVPTRMLGSYAKAINYAYCALPESFRYIFLAADDLNFYPGWLNACKSLMGDGVKVVGTNDLCNGMVTSGVHATHYLIDRAYLDEKSGTADRSFPVLFEYDHNFTDTEFIETAKSRGAFAPCLEAVVEHRHHLTGKSEIDATYDKGAKHHDRDRQIYLSRKPLWEKNHV